MAVRGDILPDEIDDFIEFWHNSDSSVELHEFLGLTWEEYSLWVANPHYVDLIIAARRNDQPIRDAVNDNLRHEERLAARSDDAGKLAALRRWIAAQSDR
jgi:type II restriction/modification system DNA methylase subunit YeeA